MIDNELAELSFTQIADAYMDLRAKGMTISVEKFAEAVPAHREKILRDLPIMLLLNDTMEDEGESSEIDLGNINIEGCLIESEIGRGASGIVFRAHQPDFERKVAVKIIDKRQSSAWVARFRVERQAMARLDHPNVVQPYSFIEHEDYDCLIMKYVDGYSLQQLIDEECDYKGRILASNLKSNWDEFAEMAASVADAIAHAHEHGMIHRDLKPSNLLLDRNGKIWVTDFGLTKLLDNQAGLSCSGDAIGTLRYMAPEQLLGVCDERSDIYSLGLTLYSLATGSVNHIDGLQTEPENGLPSPAELNPEIPPELSQVIMKACKADPADRYQTAAELVIVLKRFLSGHVPDRRRKRRGDQSFYIRDLKLWSAAVGVGLICMATTYWVLSTQKEAPALVESPTKVRGSVAETKSPLAVNPVLHSSETLLDNIMDNGTKGVDPLVEEVVRRRIDDSATSLNLTTEETNVLQEQLSGYLEEDMLRQNGLGTLIDTYRKSPLWVATRILRISRVVQLSDLPDNEKPNASNIVRQLAVLIAKERISIEEANFFEKTLTYNRLMDASEQSSLRIGESRMRDWLRKVYKRIQNEPPVNNIRDEIDALFQKANSQIGMQ